MINRILSIRTKMLNAMKAWFGNALLLENPVSDKRKPATVKKKSVNKNRRKLQNDNMANDKRTQTNSSGGMIFLKAGKKAKIIGTASKANNYNNN